MRGNARAEKAALRRKLAEAQARAARMEEELRESQERFRRILGTVPGYLFSATIVDGVPRYHVVTAGVEQVSGFTPEEHGGEPWFWLSRIHPDDRPAVDQALGELLGGSPTTLEYRIVRKDGAIRWVRDSAVAIPVAGPDGRSLRVDGVVTDVTELKEAEEANRRLQEQLHHVHKMQAIGTLAGGIAHDFNNLLGVVIGYASLLKGRVGEKDPLFGPLGMIEKSAERAADLTRQLLGFAREGKYRAEPLSLNDVVRRVEPLCRKSAEPGIVVETELAADLPPTEGDAVQVEQILTNLCLNALDAMPDGGTLRIATAREVLDETFTATRPWARTGEFVRLTCEDTGVGMTPQTMKRIFEPFFTTKQSGTNSGMGLAMAYGAMKGHGGFIDVRSEAGRGASFRLYFPVSWRARPPAETGGTADVRGGTETVLVVDPDPSPGNIAGEILSRAGYRVLRAKSGEEACSVAAQGAGKGVDLVLLDVELQGMGPKQALLALKGTLPRLSVMASTARGTEGAASELLQMGVAAVVRKPYRRDELLRSVRRALDS